MKRCADSAADDHAGNLLTTSHTGTVNWTRTQSYADASNRLATSVDSNGTFNATHDAFGNMLAMPGLAGSPRQRGRGVGERSNWRAPWGRAAVHRGHEAAT